MPLIGPLRTAIRATIGNPGAAPNSMAWPSRALFGWFIGRISAPPLLYSWLVRGQDSGGATLSRTYKEVLSTNFTDEICGKNISGARAVGHLTPVTQSALRIAILRPSARGGGRTSDTRSTPEFADCG